MIDPNELKERLSILDRKLRSFAQMVHIDSKRPELADLEERMAADGFWDDQESAQQVIQSVKAAKSLIEPYDELYDGGQACFELVEMSGDDQGSLEELASDLDELEKGYDKLEIPAGAERPL